MTTPVRLYFHGLPGGAGEIGLFDGFAGSGAAGWHVVDRTPAGAADHFADLADRIRAGCPDAPLHLAGFSLGAAAALRTARHLGGQVVQIDLVSAAAPLQMGDWLDGMAGGPLFRLARSAPGLFRVAARAQGLLAAVAPGRLFDLLFASAQGADRDLAADAQFRARLQPILADSLTRGRKAYCREIALYVGDWTAELARITQPVRLWHGAADTWSPPAMAELLAQRLPGSTGLTVTDGLSHYSALRHWLAACPRPD
jgi:pimeloyl-ACP methyl ester carboxylesterase